MRARRILAKLSDKLGDGGDGVWVGQVVRFDTQLAFASKGGNRRTGPVAFTPIGS